MKKIGLTGGIGSGKTSVGKWFKEKGMPVVDLDGIVHKVMKKAKIVRKIKMEFGDKYVSGGQVDRKLLGNLVFGNTVKRKTLERIIHPEVLNEMLFLIEELEQKEEKAALFEIPLLYEVGWENYFDQVWVVYVPEEIQKKRVMERNNLSAEEAERRIYSQLPLALKKARADLVIDNSKQWQETEKQLQELWRKCWK